MLEASCNGGAVRVNGFSNDLIQVIGSSIPISEGERQETNSFTIALPKEKTGLVVIRVRSTRFGKKHDIDTNQYFFLGVSWKNDEEAYVDLEKQWIPLADPDKMAAIVSEPGTTYYEYNLQVKIGDEVFSGNEKYQEKPGKRYVDNDIICQYLIGDITVDELKEKASAAEEEIDIRQKLIQYVKDLEIINRQLGDANTIIEQTRVILQEKDQEVGKWQKIIRELAAKFAVNEKDRREIGSKSTQKCLIIIETMANIVQLCKELFEIPWWSQKSARKLKQTIIRLYDNVIV